MRTQVRTGTQRFTGVAVDVVAFVLVSVVLYGLGVEGWWSRTWLALVLMTAIRAIVIGHNVYEGLE